MQQGSTGVQLRHMTTHRNNHMDRVLVLRIMTGVILRDQDRVIRHPGIMVSVTTILLLRALMNNQHIKLLHETMQGMTRQCSSYNVLTKQS